jgi:CheY-like chemotaxis protein
VNPINDVEAAKGLQILLAEDSLVHQKLATRLLEQRDHKVTVVNNGKEALVALERRTFDVVLMDVEMPGIDGLSATRTIRERERGRDFRVPIIAVTANDNPHECISAGVDAYLSKPLALEPLCKTLQYVLGRSAA